MEEFLDLELEQWADFELPVTVRQPSDSTTPGIPINTTGWAASGAIFKGITATIQYPFSFTFNPDPATGEVTAWIAGAKIADIPYGEYLYSIKLTDASNRVSLTLKGAAFIRGGRNV